MGRLRYLVSLFLSVLIIISLSNTPLFADSALNVKPSGNVGIGTTGPAAKLDVNGNIRATGDICTDVNGKCLSTVEAGSGGSTVWNANANGDINYNSGKVGIGTSVPGAKLQVSGGRIQLDNAAGILQFFNATGDDQALQISVDANNLARIGNNFGDIALQAGGGNVGIGTTATAHKLEVAGSAKLSSTLQVIGDIDAYGRLSIGYNNSTPGAPSYTFNGDTNTGMYSDLADTLKFSTGSLERLRISNAGLVTIGQNLVVNGTGNTTIAGNVGIGTTTPQYALDVNGTIKANGIQTAANWYPDFVFEKSYELQSLGQVESYIKENKHLPGIPSAKEVGERGIVVAEMLAKQMQKIEELTLYVIELEKRNKILDTRLAVIEKREK